MKTYEAIWRRTYEVRHRIEIEATSEKSARKKFDKLIKDVGMDDNVMEWHEESEPDDICIYEPKDFA